MTFLEAAIEILRTETEALHFAEVARRAVEQNLLSHVGRDPEAAMRNCLTNAVRGGGTNSVLVRARPGYYKIREGATLPEPRTQPANATTADDTAKEAKETAKKPARKSSKKAAKKTAKKTAKKSAKKSVKKTASKSVKKTASKAKKRSSSKTGKRRAKKASESGDATASESSKQTMSKKAASEMTDADTTDAEQAAAETSDGRVEPVEPTQTELLDLVDAEEEVDADADADADALEANDGDGEAAAEAAPAEAPPEAAEPGGGARRKRRRRGQAGANRFGVRGEAPAPQSVAVKPSRRGSDTSKRQEVLQKVTSIEFEAPLGSGMEGVTDVALVMANAMSRLAEERPELRNELEQMQQQAATSVEHKQASVTATPSASRRQDSDERGGRRRRRRRRRGRRVDWVESQESDGRPGVSASDLLLEKVAKILEDAGARSLHIRQISETLANQGVLGGEISEIERAVTASLLLDIHHRGRMSRFVARGDARYQLQGGRLPTAVAAAERELRLAIRSVEAETGAQITQWLQTLGLRGLEALVRMFLEREGYTLHCSLPAGRGMGKLVVFDPEGDDDDPRALVLIAPRKTAIETGSWTHDAERNACGSVMVFSMADDVVETNGEVRVIRAAEFARWLHLRKIGVEETSFTVSVLDPAVIESISGLDT